MYVLALFTGAGGGELSSQWLHDWRCVGYVEHDRDIAKILIARIRDGFLDDAPIWDDARTFSLTNPDCADYISALGGLAEELVITAGFPCQPFSSAGSGLGQADGRNEWPSTCRITGEIRPQWVLLENVATLITAGDGYFGQILRELAEIGYSVSWRCLSAEEVGAPHERDRVWLVAHADEFGRAVQ